MTSRPKPGVRQSTDAGIDIQRVGTDRIVKVGGVPGVFTPLVGLDAKDARSTANLERVVDALRLRLGRLELENAALKDKLNAHDAPARSSDDLASGMRHSLDALQDSLASMDNRVTDFAVREFRLETRVHVDVTGLGTIGYRFVRPGEDVDAATLSTLNLVLVPVPKPGSDDGQPENRRINPMDIEAIDGLSRDQISRLRDAHITTVGSFERVATRSTATASLISLLEVDREALGRFTLLAGLLAVPGITRQGAAMLFAAGVTDVASLSAQNPARLLRACRAAARQRPVSERIQLSEAGVTAWIQAATRLLAQR